MSQQADRRNSALVALSLLLGIGGLIMRFELLVLAAVIIGAGVGASVVARSHD